MKHLLQQHSTRDLRQYQRFFVVYLPISRLLTMYARLGSGLAACIRRHAGGRYFPRKIKVFGVRFTGDGGALVYVDCVIDGNSVDVPAAVAEGLVSEAEMARLKMEAARWRERMAHAAATNNTST